MRQEGADIAKDITLATPPTLMTVSYFIAGLSVEQWMAVLTVIYLLMMISKHAWQEWIAPWRRKK